MMRFFLKLFLFTVIVAGCTDAEQEKRAAIKTGSIFPDYRIWSEEGKEEVTCLFQFRMGGPDGQAVRLKEPATIELDGERLTPDSTRLTGAFYEMIKPIEGFKGKHVIVYTDSKNKRHELEFEFFPFSLSTELPAKIQRKDFTIQLNGFPKDRAPVHLTLTDTAFSTNDINEIVEVENGEVIITQSMLSKLKAGTIVIEIFREGSNLVNKGPGETGRIWISYGLRREVELVE